MLKENILNAVTEDCPIIPVDQTVKNKKKWVSYSSSKEKTLRENKT